MSGFETTADYVPMLQDLRRRAPVDSFLQRERAPSPKLLKQCRIEIVQVQSCPEDLFTATR